MSLILSIDSGITHFGVAAVESGGRRPEVVDAFYFHTPPSKALTKTEDCRERICRLMVEIHKLACRFAPVGIAVEGFQSMAGSERRASWETLQTLRLLGRLEGYAQAIEVWYLEIYRSSILSALGAGRKATKKEVQRCVEVLTGYELPEQLNDDDKERETIADAISVAIAQRVREPRDWAKARKAGQR